MRVLSLRAEGSVPRNGADLCSSTTLAKGVGAALAPELRLAWSVAGGRELGRRSRGSGTEGRGGEPVAASRGGLT